MLPLTLKMYDRLVGTGVVKELPTTRLYLLEHVPALRARRRLRAKYLGSNVFSFGDTAIVVRQTTPLGLRRARDFRRVVWIVDDHFAEGSWCDSMPVPYRRRLADLHDRFEPEILEIADVVLCASDALTGHYRERGIGAVHTIHPHYGGTVGDERDDAGEVTVGILQTRSHLADLRSIAPQLNRVIEKSGDVSLIHFLRGCDTGLDPSERITAMKPMPWPSYVGWTRRLEIGLYPLLDTGFNRYRSLNKFIEYLGRGAVPLVSDTSPMSMVPSDYRVGAEDWADRILALAVDPVGRRRLRDRAMEWVSDMRFQETTLETLEGVIV